MVSEFNERRHLLVAGLNDLPGVSCPVPMGAFYAFPNITGTGMTSGEFERGALQEAGVSLLSGTAFGEYGEGYVRISFANSQENIREALNRLGRWLAER